MDREEGTGSSLHCLASTCTCEHIPECRLMGTDWTKEPLPNSLTLTRLEVRGQPPGAGALGHFCLRYHISPSFTPLTPMLGSSAGSWNQAQVSSSPLCTLRHISLPLQIRTGTHSCPWGL